VKIDSSGLHEDLEVLIASRMPPLPPSDPSVSVAIRRSGC